MDYRALAELIMLSLFGLSVLTVAIGFSVRVFLAPTLRELFERLGRSRAEDEHVLARRIDRLDDRLAALESGIDRLAAAQEFDRQLVTSGDEKAGPD